MIMANKVDNEVEYRNLEQSELEEVSQLFDGMLQETIRVGPKGYYVTKGYLKMAADILSMDLKDGDTFVASYQRSGTTWTQELVWLVAIGLDYEKAAAVPLTKRYAFLEFSTFFDEVVEANAIKLFGDNTNTRKMMEVLSTSALDILAETPSPRFVKTHLPMTLLHPKILDTAKVVYVARDPRDVAVSCFHHARLFKLTNYKGNFRQTWSAFTKDLFTLTPYFEHVKEAWALRNHPNMLFLFYEDLSKDLPASIRRVADFFGKDLSSEQMERLCEHLSIDTFKNNKSVNFEEMREFGLLDARETFIRKGQAGGWRAYFDEEMQEEADRWIKKNLRDTDLKFPSMET